MVHFMVILEEHFKELSLDEENRIIQYNMIEKQFEKINSLNDEKSQIMQMTDACDNYFALEQYTKDLKTL